MRIGPYTLDNNLLLAPMAGVTDRPFRQLCRTMGAGMAVSEMVSSRSALRKGVKTLRRMDHGGETGPIAVQIVGADPREMAEAARISVGLGAQVIDINMGCPAKKVCNKAAGSALLRDAGLVRQILTAVTAATDAPVTLKIRTGWDPTNRNGVEIARIAEQSGIQALAVHGRTRSCGFSGAAEYETIRKIKQTVSIPILANGDIDSPEKARQVLNYSGADGLMIGRAAQGRPWIFREITHYLATGKALPAPPPQEVKSVVLGHLGKLYSFYGDYLGVRIARKHIAWYSRKLPGGASFRRQINNSETPKQQLTLVNRFFDQVNLSGAQAA